MRQTVEVVLAAPMRARETTTIHADDACQVEMRVRVRVRVRAKVGAWVRVGPVSVSVSGPGPGSGLVTAAAACQRVEHLAGREKQDERHEGRLGADHADHAADDRRDQSLGQGEDCHRKPEQELARLDDAAGGRWEGGGRAVGEWWEGVGRVMGGRWESCGEGGGKVVGGRWCPSRSWPACGSSSMR